MISRRHHRQLARSARYAHLFAFQPFTVRRSVTLLESTLVEVPASVDSKPLTCTVSPLDATLTKSWGRGQLLLTRNPKRIPVLSERSDSKDLSSHAAKRVDPEREPTHLLGFPSRPPKGTEGRKQMSPLAVLSVEWG